MASTSKRNRTMRWVSRLPTRCAQPSADGGHDREFGMRPFIIEPGQVIPAPENVVITEDIKVGERRLRKGQRLLPSDLTLFDQLDHPVHAIRLEETDVHEDEAGARL